MLQTLFFCLALSVSSFAAPHDVHTKMYSYFSPPSKWEPATPEIAASHVKVGFIGPNKKGFSPSVNLATEAIGEISLTEYIKAVKGIYERNPQNRWRQLGKIRTCAGESVLTEIDTKTEWGDVRLMQMIFTKDKIAYIITAAALKEEFGSYTRDFQNAFQSFNLTNDLFSAVADATRKEALKKEALAVKAALAENTVEDKKFQKEHWAPFEKKVVSEFADMGQLWQILILQDTLEK